MITLVLATALAQLDAGEPIVEDPALQAQQPPATVAAADQPPAAAAQTQPAPVPDPEALTWSPRAEIFGTFSAGQTDTAGTYDQFDLPRVHLGAEASWHHASARILIEGARSTQGGAIIGTAGDSVVIRVREAWAGYTFKFLEARLGMIPTPLLALLERSFLYRALTPDGLELYGLDSAADLGATLRANLPMNLGWVALTATNGEGYTFRELNTGKNVELTALLRPWSALSVFASGRIGSTGLADVRSDRVGGGVQWSSDTFGAGANTFYALGVSDDPSLRQLLFQAFVRGMLFDRLLWAVRAHRLQRDLDATSDDSLTTVIAAAGVRIVGPLDVFLSFQKTWASSVARAALPGSDAWSGSLVVRIRYPELSPLE